MLAGDTSFVTGLVATDVGTEPSADAVCDLVSEFVATRSEASFPQPEQNPSVVSSKQTAKTLAEVGMVDIQESFRGFLNDSVTLIKMNFFIRIVLISCKLVKTNQKPMFFAGCSLASPATTFYRRLSLRTPWKPICVS